MKKLKQLFVIGLITYLLLEMLCFTLIKTKLVKAELPAFFSNSGDTTIFPFTYADVNPYWGVWHYNYPVTTDYGCVQMVCSPNSAGARDKERTKQSSDTNRIIVLGDSFLEGYGIPVTQRVSDLLENKTNRQFLNFACADMGSTQEYLVYKHLASQYDHNTVLIGILPKNDFLNDNIAFDSIQTPRRYKPYWTGMYPDMQISYYARNLKESEFTYEAFRNYKNTFRYKLRYFFSNTTCWFNVLYFVTKKKAIGDFVKTKTNRHPYSGYYDYTNDELLRVQQSLLSLKHLASGKKLIVVTIPTADDYLRFGLENRTSPMVAALQKFADNNQITYLDMMSSGVQPSNYKELFFDCDIHWNQKGNQWVADRLYPLFK